MRAVILLAGFATCSAVVPRWPVTWAMNQSTIVMACNHSGLQQPSTTAGIGVLDFDWSNAKDQWAKAKPSRCYQRVFLCDPPLVFLAAQ